MILQIRTKDNLEELLKQGNSPAWVIAESRVPEIQSVEIYQFDGKRVLKADFDAANSTRTESDRLVVAFKNGVIEDADMDWNGQNPVRYKEGDSPVNKQLTNETISTSSNKLTKEQIENEIAAGISFNRRIEISKIIFYNLNDMMWASQLIIDSYNEYGELEEAITALKFIYHELNKKEIAIDLIKNNLDRIYSIYEHILYANFVLTDIKDKDWAVQIIEKGIAHITLNNSDEWDICKEYGNSATYVLRYLDDKTWSSELFDIAIRKIRTNGVATEFSSTFNEYLNQDQIVILNSKMTELPESVESYDPAEIEVGNNDQISNSLLIKIYLKGFELSDYELLQADELGILDMKSIVENSLPDNEICYTIISATEKSVESEGECIHELWCITDIGDSDPNDFIPNNQDAFLSISGELHTRICCYIVPNSFVSSLDNTISSFDNIMKVSNERYMSYIDGDFDSGFYM